jgi:hypothetical protein
MHLPRTAYPKKTPNTDKPAGSSSPYPHSALSTVAIPTRAHTAAGDRACGRGGGHGTPVEYSHVSHSGRSDSCAYLAASPVKSSAKTYRSVQYPRDHVGTTGALR